MTEINATPAESMKDKPVKVKLSKLTEGIGIVFMGALTMLEALDASSAQKLIGTLKLEAGGGASVNPAVGDTGEEKPDEGSPADDGGLDAADAASNETLTVESDREVKAEAHAEQEKAAAPMASTAPKTQTAPAMPTITQDDITRIIVQKIKKNRSNNEKIGALLKTYGAAKVSDLPEAKYEAFLTDLSQL